MCYVTMTTDVLSNQPQSHDYVAPELTFGPGKPRPPSTISIESIDSVVYSEGNIYMYMCIEVHVHVHVVCKYL